MSHSTQISRWPRARTSKAACMAALIAGVVACASVLYVATAGIGVLAAYDRGAALVRFALLAAGFLLFAPLSWLGAGGPGRTAAGVMSLGSLAAAAALSAYFLLTYDLDAAETHFAAVSALAELLLALRPSVTLTDTVSPQCGLRRAHHPPLDRTGGLLAVAAPPVSLPQDRPPAASPLQRCFLPRLTVITESRRGRRASPAATLAFALWRSACRITGLRGKRRRQLPRALVLAAVIAFVLAAPAQGRRHPHAPGRWTGTGTRPTLADGAIVADVSTGSGSTMMGLPTYYLLLHVGHTSHELLPGRSRCSRACRG